MIDSSTSKFQPNVSQADGEQSLGSQNLMVLPPKTLDKVPNGYMRLYRGSTEPESLPQVSNPRSVDRGCLCTEWLSTWELLILDCTGSIGALELDVPTVHGSRQGKVSEGVWRTARGSLVIFPLMALMSPPLYHSSSKVFPITCKKQCSINQ